MKSVIIKIFGFLFLITLFITAIYIANRFEDYIVANLDFGIWGMLAYFLVGIISTVFAPINSLPVIPIAVTLWGPMMTASISIASWTTGSIMAFVIARKFGRPVVSFILNMDHRKMTKMEEWADILDNKYLFWQVIVMRIFIPVDFISYAIGMLSTMKILPYSIATLIGVTPSAIILAYLVS